MDSVKYVESGSVFVTQAGENMHEIVQQVKQVNSLMNTTTSMIEMQGQDINLIYNMIHQLNDITQQNAALVEEVSAASESLTQQGKDLRTAVEVFHIAEA